LIGDFEEATVAILKHTNPCGVGSDSDLRQAWEKAFATDKQAPFGGIIICNREIDESLAKVISEIFSEVIIAPEFSGEARTILQKKKESAPHSFAGPCPGTFAEKGCASVCGGLLGAGPGHGCGRQGRVGFKTPADSKRTGSDAVRLAGGQACEIKCDRLLCA
jgi:phosphoribosylaminoimidazolecarboxamide formyltransferase/IMP cyclohydrolase